MAPLLRVLEGCEVAAACVFYTFCSSGMLVVNKLAVGHFPFPALVTLTQFSFCAAALGAAGQLGVAHLDALDARRARLFVPYVVAFALGTYSNMRVLSIATVETLVVARSTLPIAVCAADVACHDRAAPSTQTLAAFALIVAGASSYAWVDVRLTAGGYGWIGLWWVLLAFQLSYGKFLASDVPFESLWSPVLYNNLLSIPFAAALAALSGESVGEMARTLAGAPADSGWLFLSCAMGVLISYSGFLCQRLVSATSYTVLGVTNKALTVMVSQLAWPRHASPRGVAALVLCLIGGALYRQSPLRTTPSAEELATLRPSSRA